jgi:hypothetical protein
VGVTGSVHVVFWNVEGIKGKANYKRLPNFIVKNDWVAEI